MRRRAAALAVAIAAVPVGCGDLFTDAATRLSFDISREARRLEAGADAGVTFVHVPKPRPERCGGDYRVLAQASPKYPRIGGSLVVECFDLGRLEHRYDTTSHLRAVRVPSVLRVRHRRGDTLRAALAKVDGGIDLVGLE